MRLRPAADGHFRSTEFAEAHCNLGIILHDLGRLDEAEASYHMAKEINPDYALAHSNLGVASRIWAG